MVVRYRCVSRGTRSCAPGRRTLADVAALAIFSEIRPLVLTPRVSPTCPILVFDVPSEPHAHGCARLKIWNQCDQNGCYGRAPVYRTVAIRPGAGPDQVIIPSDDRASSPRQKPSRDRPALPALAFRSPLNLKGTLVVFRRARGEIAGPRSGAPGGRSTRSLVYTRHISRYTKIIIN